MTTSNIATTATPLPIPAFAPVLRPELGGAAVGLAVGEEEALLDAIDMED